ncbi:hypothetical protein BIU90_06280 [Curtobacterium sp. MCBA15_001]|nr:hypothetical protein BIU90_06280 [Curtobacterium sp. MCBA15_001]
MTATMPAHAHRASRLVTRVTDGAHCWGRLSERPVGRTMWSTRTLVVFAPGTDRRERALLRAWHAWGTVGAVLGVVAMAATASVTGPLTLAGLAVGAVVYGSGFAVLGAATRRLRPLVRSCTVTTFHGNGRPEVHGDVRLLTVGLDTLSLLETALRSGRITPVEFELAWSDVWRSMPR